MSRSNPRHRPHLGSLLLPLALLVGLLPAGCTRTDGATAPSDPGKTVVLYSSADPDVAKPIIDAFEKDTGLKVLLVGDTEATKTTGLVQRLLAEKDRPRADVWWSSEPFGTARLAKAGVLGAYTSDAAEKSIKGGWPKGLLATDHTWYAFAQRARVIVYNTDRVKPADVPYTLGDLFDPKFKDRVGMARPQFGTTGGQMAAICHVYGPDALRDWLKRLSAGGLRLYDGNMSIVRAVSQGEIFVGLADADDVYAGKRNAWPVEMVFERNDLANNPGASFGGFGTAASLKVGAGPLVLPNTVSLVKGGPNPENGKRLIDFLLSEKAERILAESESHNIPVHPRLAGEFARYAASSPMKADLERVAGAMEQALKICAEELK
jgi:iron(III) transport system substrate-binding protein